MVNNNFELMLHEGTNLESLVSVYPTHTDSICPAILVEELLQLFLQSWNLLSKPFLVKFQDITQKAY